MATIDLTNAGLRGSFRVGGPKSRTLSASGLPMTPPPAITPTTVASAVRQAIATELARMDVAVSTRATPADSSAALLGAPLDGAQTAGSFAALVQETAARVAAL